MMKKVKGVGDTAGVVSWRSAQGVLEPDPVAVTGKLEKISYLAAVVGSKAVL